MFMLSKCFKHKSLIKNLYMATSSNASYAQKSIYAENEAVIIHNEDKNTILVTLKYVNPTNKISKVFNFNRKANEEHSLLLKRISENIGKFQTKKLNKAKKLKANTEENKIDSKPVEVHLLSKTAEFIPETASCIDVLVLMGDSHYFKIGEETYYLNINPPILTCLDLPKKNIMAGFILYPAKIEGLNYNLSDSKFYWYRSIEQFEQKENLNYEKITWESVGDRIYFQTSEDDVGRILKLKCEPYIGEKKGIACEDISKVLVTAGPGKCPFETRHKITSNVLGLDSFRVVSYNILADLYADSDFSRSTLFPTCPPYALNIDYRKQLLLKEIIGYNADILCLQEVDEKVFRRDLQPILSHNNLEGIYKSKGGEVAEGSAIFYRKEKFRLEEENCFLLREEIQNNSLFSDILEKVKKNEKALGVIISRPSILQVNIFVDTHDSSKLIVVATTHLYFEPLSDHIRLLQAGMCITLLQQIIEMKKLQYPECRVSLLFCGDFNSDPNNAVYRLMTTQLIEEDDVDWASKPDEELQGIGLSFSHSLEIESACGTPDYTNYTVGFQGCLDYIFYQSDYLTVNQIIPFPTHEEVTAHGALPSITFPSDHLALVVDLNWKN